VVALSDGEGTDIRAGTEIRFGETERDRVLPLRHARHDRLQLLFRREFQQAMAYGVVHVHQHSDAALNLREFREDGHVLRGRETDATKPSRNHQAEGTHFQQQGIDNLVRHVFIVLDLLLERVEIPPDRFDNIPLERLVFRFRKPGLFGATAHRHAPSSYRLVLNVHYRLLLPSAPDLGATRKPSHHAGD
jgi:hypothetical protein